MTREEAIIKLRHIPIPDLGLIAALEALGLLKFEEKPRPTAKSIICEMFETVGASSSSTRTIELINWLDRMGYKIVDK